MTFKKALIGLGIGAVIVGGICLYFDRQKDYLTWEEYLATIELYNRKLEEIKGDCDNDVRCATKGAEKRVIFRDVKNKKDILDQLNQWIENDEEDPDAYKLIPKIN